MSQKLNCSEETIRRDLKEMEAQNKLKRIDAIFWPYNKNELQVNKNLQQNPAFGNGENSSYETTK